MRQSRMKAVVVFCGGAGLCGAVAVAQQHDLTIDDACIPLEAHEGSSQQESGHSLVTAHVSPELAGGSLRLFFRRMDIEVEDFYWVSMYPEGDGRYWAVMPDPEDFMPVRKELDGNTGPSSWAAWWKAKEASPPSDRDPNGDLDSQLIHERAALGSQESRTWMEKLSEEDLQAWLEGLENQPTEYEAGLFNSSGELVAKSEMKVGPVVDRCESGGLTRAQEGESFNQTIGETSAWQHGRSVYHWECDHIVSRIDSLGVKAADTVCRGCGIVWWQRGWVPFALAGPPLFYFPEDHPNEPPPEFKEPASVFMPAP